MTTSTTAPRLPFWLGPFEWVGRSMFSSLSYLGGVALLLMSAAISLVSFSRDDERPGFWFTFKGELSWLLMMGFPVVGLVHVGTGSFLSLQAYFGSTFVDGTGAVVGVGLLRNLATLMTGLTMSGLLAGRIISVFFPGRGPIVHDPASAARSSDVSNRPSELGEDHGVIPEPGWLAAPRLAAAAVSTTLLSLWGFAVGTVVGWQCADTMMGLSSETFFLMFYRMIWFRDVVGVMVKGTLFGLFPAAICCYEGLRAWDRPSLESHEQTEASRHPLAGDLGGPIVRATCLSMVSILILNMTWFLLVYHAVPIYGPSLLSPPTP